MTIGRRLATIGILTAVAGCGEHVEGPSSATEMEGSNPGLSWEDYRARFNSESGALFGEWDLEFSSEEQLYEHYVNWHSQSSTRSVNANGVAGIRQGLHVQQRLSTGYEPVYGTDDALDIVYCVASYSGWGSFQGVPRNKADVIADMAIATSDWERSANVRFRYDPTQDVNCTSSNTSVDFAVIPVVGGGPDFPRRLAGCGVNKLMWPGSPDCGGQFGVLELLYTEIRTSGVTAPGVLRHELGHVIGFRHEHAWAASQSPCFAEPVSDSAYDLAGRQLTDVAYDQSSVMHYPQCNGNLGSDMTLSGVDQMGAISVYGIPAAWYSTLM